MADCRKSAIDADDSVGPSFNYLTVRICGRHGPFCTGRDEFRGSGIKIDVGTAMIEMNSHARITLCRFDHCSVQRRATNRIDELVRIAVVWGKMEGAGFVVNHATAHWNGVPQHFVGDSELLERVNSAGRKSKINGASANDISLTRISASFV